MMWLFKSDEYHWQSMMSMMYSNRNRMLLSFVMKLFLWMTKTFVDVFSKKHFLMIQGSINKIKRATRLSRKEFSNLFSLSILQFNNTCIQSSKHVNEDLNCSSIVDLHMNSIISKIRRWRIELCADVCNDVRFDCGEDEEHHLISMKLM